MHLVFFKPPWNLNRIHLSPISHFLGAKNVLFTIINGKSEKTIYSGSDMAYHSPMSKKIKASFLSADTQCWGKPVLSKGADSLPSEKLIKIQYHSGLVQVIEI